MYLIKLFSLSSCRTSPEPWGGSRILWRGVRVGVRRFPERYFWAKVNVQIGIFHTNEWAKGGFDWIPQSPPGSATVSRQVYCTRSQIWLLRMMPQGTTLLSTLFKPKSNNFPESHRTRVKSFFAILPNFGSQASKGLSDSQEIGNNFCRKTYRDWFAWIITGVSVKRGYGWRMEMKKIKK